MAEYLTRAFFEQELEALAKAYESETGARKVTTELILRSGTALRLEGKPRCTDAYVIVDYKVGNHLNRAVIPYAAIVGVAFAPEGSSTVGFHR